MNKTISINGLAMVTTDEKDRVTNVQFLPDDEMTAVLEHSGRSHGDLIQLRNGSFDYVAGKPRVRANSTLLAKAAHGRISATKDGAYQLTLKVFKCEGLDVRETFARESFELIQNVHL